MQRQLRGENPIEARRIMERQIRSLEPSALLINLDARELNTRGTWETLVDRLIRFELRANLGEHMARWDPIRDGRSTGLPLTVPVWDQEPSIDEHTREVQSPVERTRMGFDRGAVERQTPDRVQQGEWLPTGQSTGRYQDPLTLSNLESSLNWEDLPAPTRNTPTVTFRDPPEERQESDPEHIHPASSTRHGEIPNLGLSEIPEEPIPPLPTKNTSPQLPILEFQDLSIQQLPEQRGSRYQASSPRPRESHRTQTTHPQQPLPHSTRSNPLNERTYIQSNPQYAPFDRSTPYIPHPTTLNETTRNTSRYNPFMSARIEEASENIRRLAEQVQKMNIRFGGKPNESPEEFLLTLADMVKSLNMTESEMVRILPFVLEGPVLSWFRLERDHIQSYEKFIESFRLRYSSPDLQLRLWEEIRQRTQGPHEPVIEYISKMQVLLSHLEVPLPLQQQLDLTYNNLHPRYITLIDPSRISTFRDFYESAQAAERKVRRMSAYLPPPSPDKTIVQNSACSRPNKLRTERVTVVEEVESPDELTDSENQNLTRPAITTITRPTNPAQRKGSNKRQAQKEIHYAGAIEERLIMDEMIKLMKEHPAENRFFIRIRLNGNKFRGLLDTGATRTFAGPRVRDAMSQYIVPTRGRMKVADGQMIDTTGCVAVKFEMGGKSKILPVRMSESLAYDMVLGMDFIADWGISISGRRVNWGGSNGEKDHNDDTVMEIRPLLIDSEIFACETVKDPPRKAQSNPQTIFKKRKIGKTKIPRPKIPHSPKIHVQSKLQPDPIQPAPRTKTPPHKRTPPSSTRTKYLVPSSSRPPPPKTLSLSVDQEIAHAVPLKPAPPYPRNSPGSPDRVGQPLKFKFNKSKLKNIPPCRTPSPSPTTKPVPLMSIQFFAVNKINSNEKPPPPWDVTGKSRPINGRTRPRYQ